MKKVLATAAVLVLAGCATAGPPPGGYPCVSKTALIFDFIFQATNPAYVSSDRIQQAKPCD